MRVNLICVFKAVFLLFLFFAPASFSQKFNVQWTSLKGKRISGHTTKNKVVLLHYWATWCAPCKAQFPTIEYVRKIFGEEELEIIGVAVKSKQKDVVNFLKTEKLSWPQVFLEGESDHFSNSLEIDRLPLFAIVDLDGKVHSLKGLSIAEIVENVGKYLKKEIAIPELKNFIFKLEKEQGVSSFDQSKKVYRQWCAIMPQVCAFELHRYFEYYGKPKSKNAQLYDFCFEVVDSLEEKHFHIDQLSHLKSRVLFFRGDFQESQKLLHEVIERASNKVKIDKKNEGIQLTESETREQLLLSHPLRLIFFKDAVINELSKAVVSKHLISEKIHSVEVWNAIFNFIKTVKDREKREELVEVWNECVSDIKANFIENRQLLHDYGVEMSNL